jgi:hypothetical protein
LGPVTEKRQPSPASKARRASVRGEDRKYPSISFKNKFRIVSTEDNMGKREQES